MGQDAAETSAIDPWAVTEPAIIVSLKIHYHLQPFCSWELWELTGAVLGVGMVNLTPHGRGILRPLLKCHFYASALIAAASTVGVRVIIAY